MPPIGCICPCLVCEFSLQFRMHLVRCFWAAALTGTIVFFHLSEFVRGTFGRIMPSLLLFSSASALKQSAARSDYFNMRSESGEPTLPVCFVWARVFAAVYAARTLIKVMERRCYFGVSCVVGVNKKKGPSPIPLKGKILIGFGFSLFSMKMLK